MKNERVLEKGEGEKDRWVDRTQWTLAGVMADVSGGQWLADVSLEKSDGANTKKEPKRSDYDPAGFTYLDSGWMGSGQVFTTTLPERVLEALDLTAKQVKEWSILPFDEVADLLEHLWFPPE